MDGLVCGVIWVGSLWCNMGGYGWVVCGVIWVGSLLCNMGGWLKVDSLGYNRM